MREDITIKSLYTLEESIAGEMLDKYTHPWEALSDIGDMIIELGKKLPTDRYTEVSENVWIADSAKVMDSAHIFGPCIIGEDSEVRHCAFIRGKVLIGDNCVVGNSTELKNVILFNHVQVPHFNYVGDSILGAYAHMGAGSITSNVKSDKENVVIKCHFRNIETGIKKVGAFLGDHVEIGCGSVLNPGTIIGKNTNVYPLSSVRGVVSGGSVYKSSVEIVDKL